MPTTMQVQPFETLLRWILQELEANRSVFGIPRSLFYTPNKASPCATPDMFGHYLATPIGPAAGPHTQLAQNIVCAWLSGGRFIELKTVQIMDELEIPRPCIDIADEGYNVEWSQELRLEQSAGEYVKAWALIHVLHRALGFWDTPVGTIFNMSVGYNLAGIQSPPLVLFMDRLADASQDLAEIQAVLQAQFPQLADVDIPSRLTDNVTLSTMHGCPPDEIEQIARHLLLDRGLHTIVKLNPTLLGKATVLRILHDDLGFREIQVPDRVFEHDLHYPRAVALIKSLKEVAAQRGLTFGVKLSNTLAMANHRGLLPGDEMYMSGRAIYPITINLFHKLAQEFGGDLNVSYSGGADALNVTALLAAGARPVSTASDLLKPGGYSRLRQYLEELETGMRRRGAASLDDLARDKLANLEQAAAEALCSPRYKKHYHPYGLPKVESGLGLFDCITAPCVEQCAVCQDVPEYAWLIAQGEYHRALEVILARNPLPAVTGYVCTHRCQTRCTRNNYDQPVTIRALKRFASEHGALSNLQLLAPSITQIPLGGQNRHVAIVGSGPSGLAGAYFLALNGIQATVFESRDVAGGMLSIAPAFRLPRAVVDADIDRIKGLGVQIELSHPVTMPPEALLEQGFDAVYVACGFQDDARLGIEGEEGHGVFSALDLLARVAKGERPDLGSRVLVIGGGNTAMDAARTACRLTGRPATVIYRRTREEMPACEEEVADLLAEGNALEELVSPVKIRLQGDRVAALRCVRNRLGEAGPDGRRKPAPIPGSEFEIEADAIVVAVGQRPDLSFFNGSAVNLRRDGSVVADPHTGLAGPAHIYAGGDAARGPAIIIEACADGRRAAEAICSEFGFQFRPPPARRAVLSADEIVQVKRARARQEPQYQPAMLPAAQRPRFGLIEPTLPEETARHEAARCLQCSTFCDKCVEVCPNRANYSYHVTPVSLVLPRLACRDGKLVVSGKEAFQVKQLRQIVHLYELCNECGNCATFCVHQAKPYQDKPRLFLQESGFLQQDNNAFYVKKDCIRRREGYQESRLSVNKSETTYEDARVRLCFSSELEVQSMTLKQPFDGDLSLAGAAEMMVILNGIQGSLPFLL
jgi:putative selenate reductase